MRASIPAVSSLLLLALCVLPGLASAQFTVSKPKEVGTVFMPFEAEREADDSLAFLLEDLVGAKLMRKVKRPVHVGRDVTVALTGTPASCLGQSECVQLLGGQFNSSLVASVLVKRVGSSVQLDTSWFTTGNGLKAHKEVISFPVGQEDRMLDELVRVIEELFDASLLITPSSLAREGGIISGGDDKELADELRRSKEKTVRSRREDFGGGSSRLEDDEPETDLRSAVEEEADEVEEPPPPRKSKRAPEPVAKTDVSDLEDDDESEVDLDEVDDREDEPEPVEDDRISLRADDDTGDSVTNYMQAQKLGIGKREYQRLTRSGLPFDDYMARRWAYGKRLYLRVGAFYGLGGLERRYSTTIFVRAGNVLTEEYRFESLGFSALNPGGQIGVGFAPVDFLEIDLDVGLMYATQELRRDYFSQDFGSNYPVEPESVATAHVIGELRARFLIFPYKRVKLTPSIGASMLFMAGYNINSEPPLAYSSRPPGVVVGVTAGFGAVIALTPSVGLDLDLAGTYFVSQGATRHVEYEMFGGVVEPYLDPQAIQEPIPPIPVMARITVGPRFLF